MLNSMNNVHIYHAYLQKWPVLEGRSGISTANVTVNTRRGSEQTEPPSPVTGKPPEKIAPSSEKVALLV